MTKTIECANCAFMKLDSGLHPGVGYCVIYPPVITMLHGHAYSIWPSVNFDDRCGEWQSMELAPWFEEAPEADSDATLDRAYLAD